jgi:hypothetical protein
MAGSQEPLKLGKGAYFVKSRLRRLPQTDDEWQVDFQPFIPRSRKQKQEWLGIVLSLTDDFLLAEEILDNAPTVNDLARLLANAMRRPFIDRPHRPKRVLLRDNPTWQEILLRQDSSSQSGNHGTHGRTRKGKVDSNSIFRVFQWIPWLISDPSGAAIGCCWTESAVRICADLVCLANIASLERHQNRSRDPGCSSSVGQGVPRLGRATGINWVKQERRSIMTADEINRSFPNIADWIQESGWIEIGNQEWQGSSCEH